MSIRLWAALHVSLAFLVDLATLAGKGSSGVSAGPGKQVRHGGADSRSDLLLVAAAELNIYQENGDDGEYCTTDGRGA